MFQTKKASVLVYSLLILSIMLVIAISISSVSTKNMQGTMTSNKSAQAFQTADSGMEVMMKKIKDVDDRMTVTIGSLGGCNEGKIILSSEDIGKGTSEISFFSVDEDAGTSTRIESCSSFLSEVDEIKSIGSYGDTVRAVKMRLAEEVSSSGEFSCNNGSIPSGHIACDDAETGLTADGTWEESSDSCASDVKCKYEEISGPGPSCAGSVPTTASACSAGNESGTWHYVATCGSDKCDFICPSSKPIWNATSQTCSASGGGCTPDNSCAANTCKGDTCSDGCGGQVAGTKECYANFAVNLSTSTGVPLRYDPAPAIDMTGSSSGPSVGPSVNASRASDSVSGKYFCTSDFYITPDGSMQYHQEWFRWPVTVNMSVSGISSYQFINVTGHEGGSTTTHTLANGQLKIPANTACGKNINVNIVVNQRN
jgi:hypothetical protein